MCYEINIDLRIKMAANDEDSRGLNDVDSDSNHEVSENSDNKINPDYASMAARLLFVYFLF